MGIPAPPPSLPPQQQQQQQQQQQETQTIGELLQQQQSESDANSRAESTTVNSASQTNVQVNNNSNRVEWDGIKVPETTINLSVYGNQNDVGVIGTVSIPLGGKSRKYIRQGLQNRVAMQELEYERTYLSACASMHEQGYYVTRNAVFASRLSQCDQNIVARAQPVVHKQIVQQTNNSELDTLRQQNELLKQQIQVLMNRLDNHPVRGTY